MSGPMTCALCGKKYPWEADYWPGGKVWAQCWHCWVKEHEGHHEAALSHARFVGQVLAVLALVAGVVVGAWMKSRGWLAP